MQKKAVKERKEKDMRHTETKSKMADCINALNTSGLNNPITKQRLLEWRKKNNILLYAVYRRHFRFSDTNRLKEKEWIKNVSCK